jgi:hypothetical protein
LDGKKINPLPHFYVASNADLEDHFSKSLKLHHQTVKCALSECKESDQIVDFLMLGGNLAWGIADEVKSLESEVLMDLLGRV